MHSHILFLILIIVFTAININANPNIYNENDYHSGQSFRKTNSQNPSMQDFNNANLLFYQQKYKDALKIFEDILANTNDLSFIKTIKTRIAETHEKLGNYDDAIKIYQSLIKESPENTRLKFSIANLYRWQKKFEQSIEIFSEIMTHDDNYYELIGNIYLEDGKPDLTFKTWNKIIGSDSRNLNKFKRLAYIFYQAGMINESIDIYLKARSIFSNSHLFSIELAELHEFQMEYKKAADEYLSLLNSSPEQFEYIQEKIIALVIKEKNIHQYCVDKIRVSLDANPNNNNFRLILVDLLINNQQIDMAIKEHEKIVEKNPDKKNILLLSLSEDLEKMGYKKEAIETYQKIGINYISYPHAQTKIIELLVAIDQDEDAVEKARKFIATNPRMDYLETSLYYSSLAYFKLKKFADARSGFIKITQMDSNSNFYYQCLAKIADTYFKEGNYDQALKDYNNILNIPSAQSVHDYANFMITQTFVMTNKYEEATGKLKDFIKKYQDSLYVNDALEELNFLSTNINNSKGMEAFFKSRFLFTQGKSDEAIQGFENIIKIYPKSILAEYTYLQIGKIYMETSKFKEAVIALQNLKISVPESALAPFAQDKIASIYAQKIKDKDKAIEAYQKIITDYPGSILVSRAHENIRKLNQQGLPVLEQ
ncbi:tetratricopeptide repeat protein [Candidatus Poribacteria bacterium]|nr:tetratricopeptide repeat protein [Candidatus Poribacteria bacterium]